MPGMSENEIDSNSTNNTDATSSTPDFIAVVSLLREAEAMLSNSTNPSTNPSPSPSINHSPSCTSFLTVPQTESAPVVDRGRDNFC